MAQANLATAPHCAELEAREGIGRNGVRRNSVHIADCNVGVVQLEQGADTLTQPGQVGTLNWTADRERDGLRRRGCHPGIDPPNGENSSVWPPMSSVFGLGLTTRKGPTHRKESRHDLG
jgi:hypothetical protein